MMLSRVPPGLAMSDRRKRIHELVLALLAQEVNGGFQSHDSNL